VGDKQNAVVECEELTKVYSSVWTGRSKAVCALRDVSLSVSRGQIVGLIGPNGAGKTTLLNLIAGLILPNEGRISICAHPARSIEARRRLGYMPEYPAFQNRYSARAVLQYHGGLMGLSRSEIADEADRLIHELKLKEFINRPCSGFSQGMKQRLSLAIALMKNPEVLLLDEPSNGLDPVGIIELRNVLKQLRESGTTIVISSHRLGELEKLTSNYIFLYRGQIVSFGDKITSGQAGRLRVELISDGRRIAEKVLPPTKVLNASDTELVIAVSDPKEVPAVVSKFVEGGAEITGVILQTENIEDVFLRLYNERN
ncbi:ABC transporter ATP-binding protein, partial [Planctomycetota bacterium]